ncbi:hypothetical protein H0H92_001104 [Tricholoma furcatifolium]|nr:hypothetical protein H0H92_001104 [Tricholoma furcatifolium]
MAHPGPSSSPFTAHFPTYTYVYPNGTVPLSPLPKQLFMPPPDSHSMPCNHLPPSPYHSPPPPIHQIYSPPPQQPLQPEPQSPPKPRNPVGEWAIWSRRPQNPLHAPGIIFSPRSKPPQHVIQKALELPTPPPSPTLLTKELSSDTAYPHHHEPEPEHEPDQTYESVSEPEPVASSSATETTDRDTPAAVSPATSVTSLSASVDNATKPQSVPPTTLTSPASVPALSLPALEPEPTPVPTPTPPPKKSWASLLQSSSSTPAAPGQKRLPTSSVVGISISGSSLSQSQPPSSAQSQPPFAHPALSLPHLRRTELLHLLTSEPDAGLSPLPVIRPRGLINAGNMCFANSVLQVLLFCPPFHKLFTELARFGFVFRSERDKVAKDSGKDGKEREREREKEGKGPTPLVDAVVEFVREFSPAPRKSRRGHGHANGKGKERDESGDEDEGVAFLPSYVYDAMKEKTVFDGMRSGQQEDAEEFLGFFLDALEEELLAVVQALSGPPPAQAKKTKAGGKAKKAENGVEEKEVEEDKEDGWLEVGKRNRMVVTRTIKVAETPITRIFGGKVRSTLKAPGQKDSQTIEAWRALRLDIQTDSIRTLPDALAHMAAPQALELDGRHASIQHLLEAVPPVLVVHLKRFCYDKDVGGVVKVGKAVQWGEELELGGDVMAPAARRGAAARYKLFGALYHHGQSASGGHYTLDVLHPGRNAVEGWMRIDDELVSDVHLGDVFAPQHDDESKAAYLLFYRRIR